MATAMLAVAVGAAAADDQTAFIVDVTHAYYAKALCQGLDIVYDVNRHAKRTPFWG